MGRLKLLHSPTWSHDIFFIHDLQKEKHHVQYNSKISYNYESQYTYIIKIKKKKNTIMSCHVMHHLNMNN